MKTLIFNLCLVILLLSFQACSYDSKPDAVVVENDQVSQTETTAVDTSSYALAETADTTTVASASPTTANSNTNRKAIRTKAAAVRALRQDARLARTMSLQRFGNYMTRRWAYYRGFGEVSYDDDQVEIKITNEELKIETPEGKYKREKDEMKLKTDTRKVKKEIRS